MGPSDRGRGPDSARWPDTCHAAAAGRSTPGGWYERLDATPADKRRWHIHFQVGAASTHEAEPRPL